MRTEGSTRNSTSGTHVDDQESTTELRNAAGSWMEPRKRRIGAESASETLAIDVGSGMMTERQSRGLRHIQRDEIVPLLPVSLGNKFVFTNASLFTIN